MQSKHTLFEEYLQAFSLILKSKCNEMMPFTTAKQHLFLQKEKAKQLIINYLAICTVRLIGLEPTRHEPLDPKSSASTNFATSALWMQRYNKIPR